MQVSETSLVVPADDGTPLAVTCFLPEGDGPFATLMEALPYRQHDVTASYADTYRKYAGVGGFAVLRVDLRGTGSSGGLAEDEYPDVERRDLAAVIRWATAQPWSNGKVGMWGTSYSGFNSLHMAAEGVPGLAAVCAIYATDDRYTDDVHYMGGALRALDLIDYPLYMVCMNALPPVPAVWGEGWMDEWRRRLDHHEPWLLDWLRHPLPDDVWRRGSVRLGPGSAGYERFTCPVLLFAGWADGYRNNTFRTLAHAPSASLLAGPWSHKAAERSLPGPNIDGDGEILAFFDHHLRGGPAPAHRARVFVRRPVPPQPDLVRFDGHWVAFDEWPLPGAPTLTFRTDAATDVVDRVVARGDVGIAAWNSCAGGLPWGQPLDQRHDNAMSCCLDWPVQHPATVLGNGSVRMRLRSTASVGHVSVKLCDVDGEGNSHLVTRGFLDLTHRGVWPSDGQGELGAAPRPIVPGEWMDVEVGLEATTWSLEPGHVLRLAIAGTDWPNCWPPAEPFALEVQRASVVLELPDGTGVPLLDPQLTEIPRTDPPDHTGIEWRTEHDVLRRETSVHTRYGETYEGAFGTVITDHYEGHVGIRTDDFSKGWARGVSSYVLEFPEGTCTTESRLDMTSDREAFHVTVSLVATWNGDVLADRSWTEHLPR